MKRAKLRQVVSAVYNLRKGRGARLGDIEAYLRVNYGVLSAPEYKPTLKLAVREGFLKYKNNKFHPLSLVPPARSPRHRTKKRSSALKPKSKLLSMALDLLMARRRRKSGRRRRRGGRRHSGVIAARRRRRMRRRAGQEGEANNQKEENKPAMEEASRETLGSGQDDQGQNPPQDNTPSPLLEQRTNEQDGYYYFG